MLRRIPCGAAFFSFRRKYPYMKPGFAFYNIYSGKMNMMYKKHNRNWWILLLLGVLILAGLQGSIMPSVQAEDGDDIPYSSETARPSVNGRLHVQGPVLADESGKEVQLRGVSTHGLTWYPDYIDPAFISAVSREWDCNFIRFAMYTDIYCSGEKERSTELMMKGIDAAVAADMYVLVDWHILSDYDPNINKEEAAGFFRTITEKYKNCDNLLFEICNEPNGPTDWADVMRYSNEIIPVIRENMPEAVIVVGTPDYDRVLSAPLMRPLPYDNLMYVLHFYAASHKDGLRGELQAAYDAGLPVLISECGICEDTGDGTIDFASAAEWFSYLKEKNISYTVWSLSDKDESSAFFKPGHRPSGTLNDNDLTLSGKWVRELIRGADPDRIPRPAAAVEKGRLSDFRSWLAESLGPQGYKSVQKWQPFALISGAAVILFSLLLILFRRFRNGTGTYDDLYPITETDKDRMRYLLISRILVVISAFAAVIYLCWRIFLSIPFEAGIPAVTANLLLLAVEILGFAETLVLYANLLGMRDHPLPEITAEEFPDVDIFISTYNEPAELLRKTINGAKHMRYPDPAKVHIWLCDDNRRPEMRRLAGNMGIGYFDRPDNQGAKAGNLNAALARTCAPYIVTFDADMIPKSDFLLKTIPYFTDAEKRSAGLPAEKKRHLGLLQTPQCFYDPDVFQYALYSEKRAPNEQDFFYRTIEVAKTTSNSVIYGGSNTVISREALNAVGGFYTGSITEDFATGLLIESNGFVSLGLDEPLASGQSPNTYKDHIKQRSRWGRGVIATARQLKIFRRKGLTAEQKISYWSSVIYWYSPLKNLIYLISPLFYAVLAIPVFRCTWLDLLVFWLPMYILQDSCLRYVSRDRISAKWSGIYETSVMPHLLKPVIQEFFGVTMSSFKVTDKSAKSGKREMDIRSMRPFLILIILSVFGIIRILAMMSAKRFISLAVILFWLIRNLYFLIMSVFLVDGRDGDGETVRVSDAEPVTVTVEHGKEKGSVFRGVTTMMTEHKLCVYLDEGEKLTVGMPVKVVIAHDSYTAELQGTVSDVTVSRNGTARTQTIEILDFGNSEEEYLQILYDRIPTLPQSLHGDFGIVMHLWQNIAHRAARTRL